MPGTNPKPKIKLVNNNTNKAKNRNKEIINSYINNARQAESNNDSNAKNPNSSATGLFQFTKDTWKDMEKQVGRKLDILNSKDQEIAMRAFTNINAETLEKNNLPVTAANLYTTHVLGKSGGTKFIKALMKNPNESATKYASDSAIKANTNLFFNKEGHPVAAAELYNNLSDKANGTSQEEETEDNSQDGQDYQDYSPEPEFNNTEIDSTRVDQPERILKPSKPITQIEDTSNQNQNNNPVEQRRLSLGLTGNNLDFLSKDIGLAFNQDQESQEQVPDDEVNKEDNNMAKYGGSQEQNRKLKANSPTEGLLNEFNEGGLHEENPHGGIPQGVGGNGKLNTVEQGETKFNDYVFSDTLKVSEADTDSLYLPKKIAGKTFAEASKYINDVLKDNPNDSIVKKTVKKHLDALTLGNEKARLAKQQLDLNLGNNPNSQNYGEDLQEPNQMFLGGNENEVPDPIDTPHIEGKQDGANLSGAAGGAASGLNTNLGGSTMGMIGQGLGSLGDGLSAMKKQSDYYDHIEGDWDAKAKGVGATKDTVAGAVSTVFPIAGLFRGIEKAGQGLGDAIGGDGGNYVKYAFSPDEAIMKNNSDPDVSTGDKILGTILPFHAAKTSKRAADRRQAKLSYANALMMNSGFRDNYELGGFMDTNNLEDGGKTIRHNKYKKIYNSVKEFDDINKPEEGKYTGISEDPREISNYDLYNSKDGYSNPELAPQGKAYSAKQKNMMQYAPVLGDFMNMIDANRAKPETEFLQKSTERYKPNYVDEAYLQNMTNNNYDNTINSLTNASGGSAAALRASILGASANRASDQSEAYFRMNEINRKENSDGQRFNADINRFNIGQDNNQKQINDQNRAVIEDRRNLSRDAFYKDLGSIGREETYDNRLQNLTGGYDSQGNYNKDDLEFLRKMFGQEREDNKKRLGGSLSEVYDSHNNSIEKKLEKILSNKYR